MQAGGGGGGEHQLSATSVLTSCESLGCTTEKWHKNLPSRLSECITDSFPSETKKVKIHSWKMSFSTIEAKCLNIEWL